MQSPSPIYLSHWVHGGFLDPILRLLQSAVDVAAANSSNELTPNLLPSVDQLEKDWSAMLPQFEKKEFPFYIQEEIILSSRALQSLAVCQILVKILTRCGSRQSAEAVNKKNKSASSIKVKLFGIEQKIYFVCPCLLFKMFRTILWFTAKPCKPLYAEVLLDYMHI
ncbi:unnamed protein product [Cylicostephanus goldi]|uniref:Uncharacterized protein n=1 Tax=Cylicostephanus goldi TaxID=71465 RepID=A0A3P6TA68_CYLGO|nr:unnamed protein product [Cylicostephanus goldi]